MKKISGIYKIESKIHPDRCYIGSTVNIKERWVIHLSSLKRGYHHNPKLQNHYNKYGEKDLAFSILFRCSRGDLIKYEQLLINVYNPWFNIRLEAKSQLGLRWKLSEEAKQNMRKPKIRRSNKRRYYPPRIRVRKPSGKEIIREIKIRYNLI